MKELTNNHRFHKLKYATRGLGIIAFALVCAITLCLSGAYAAEPTLISSDKSAHQWPLANVTQTDIILHRWKMGFNNAEIHYNAAADGNYETRTFEGEYDIPGAGIYGHGSNRCSSLRYKTAVEANKETPLPGTITLVFRGAATLVDGSADYDLVMKISDITIKTNKNAVRKQGVPVIWGCSEALQVGAFGYDTDDTASKAKDPDGQSGMKYTFDIYLYKAGTYEVENKTPVHISTNKKMLWGFEDVDVSDQITELGGYHIYDASNYPWAEHVTMSTPSSGIARFYNDFYVSSKSILNIKGQDLGNSVTVYDTKLETNTGGNTDFLYIVNPYHFSYVWQGSSCGTAVAVVGGTEYTGYSYIYKGTQNKDSARITNGSTIEVNGPEQTLLFYHYIHRDEFGPDSDKEQYYVTVQKNLGAEPATGTSTGGVSGHECTSAAPCVYTARPKGYKYEDSNGVEQTHSGDKQVYKKTLTVSLQPGETKNRWQRLWYQKSNINETLYALSAPYRSTNACKKAILDPSGNVTTAEGIADLHLANTACVQLHRPRATFTASVSATVNADGGDTFTAPSTSAQDPKGTKITSSDGSFKIKFSGYVQRLSADSTTGLGPDEAGGEVSERFATYISKSTYDEGNIVSGTRNPATANTTNITDHPLENDETYSAFSDNSDDFNTYSGTLRRGESITICGVIKYRNSVDYSVLNADGTVKGYTYGSPAYKCVTVYRESKSCKIDGADAYKYGYFKGENLGGIGVVNHTLNPSGDYQYTAFDPGTIKSATNHTVSTTIYARPGDSVRFAYEICAGGAYVVNSNENLDEPNHRTIYETAGSLSNSSSSGYLFGREVSDIDSSYTEGLRYTKEKTWSSQSSSLLQGENVEASLKSPSGSSGTDPDGSNPATYSDGTYNTRSYSCIDPDKYDSAANKNALDFHYQIAGNSTGNGCHAYSKTGVTSDVGHTITQSLSWNHLKLEGSETVKPTIKDNTQFTAKANIKIPYNYVVKPAMSAETGGKNVVYLGSTVDFNSDLYVLPRTNTIFGDDSIENKYATITKKSTVSIKYYFKHATGSPFYTSNTTTYNNVVMNNQGSLKGTAEKSGTVANGGHKYETISVKIDDAIGGRTVSIGDRVCAEITVSPADSHNNKTAASVYGERVTSASSETPGLSENGTSSDTATACYTIAKKPTMSVEASNAYAGGNRGFVTSKYTKQFGTDTTKYLFGSWSEYGVYGKVSIASSRGMASGATFGYPVKNDGITINAARNNSGEVAKDDSSHGSTCAFSTQTFNNDQCNVSSQTTIGKQGMGKEQAEEFRKRIYDRFSSSDREKNAIPKEDNRADRAHKKGYEGYCRNWSWKATITDNEADRCVKDDKGNKYAGIRAWMNDSEFDANGINRTHVEGDAYIGAGNTFLTVWGNHNFKNNQEYVDQETGITYADRNYTRLIEVDGTLIIDADIKVGYYKKYTNNWGQVIEESDDDPILENSGEVVQFIIIADKIKITSRVNRLDAVIIANEIDTCAYNIPKSSVSNSNNGFKTGKALSVGATNNDGSPASNSISVDTCDNQLVFRGPVATQKIALNRTFGAGSGTDSIKRAEIFDLNPYNYLWSYGQMSRYSQAVTTYSREVAPRY